MARTSAAGMNVVRATGARLTAPADLSAAEREHWIAIVDSLPADFFRPSDAHLLRSYCIASAFYTMAADEMKRDGITIVDAASGRSRPHPAATILTSQASAMAQMAVKLRLCPSSRTTSARAETKAKASVAAAKRPWQSAG